VARNKRGDTAETILDIAEQLAQTLGFSGFSYADIATRLGLTRASLHYHFPSKAELGRALIVRYRVRFLQELAAIDHRETAAPARLRAYADLYHQVLRNDRMSLCGMLAAEIIALPPAMQAELRTYFEANERWLSGVLREGSAAGQLTLRSLPEEEARVLLGSLEGAMLTARAFADSARFAGAAGQLLARLQPTP